MFCGHERGVDDDLDVERAVDELEALVDVDLLGHVLDHQPRLRVEIRERRRERGTRLAGPPGDDPEQLLVHLALERRSIRRPLLECPVVHRDRLGVGVHEAGDAAAVGGDGGGRGEHAAVLSRHLVAHPGDDLAGAADFKLLRQQCRQRTGIDVPALNGRHLVRERVERDHLDVLKLETVLPSQPDQLVMAAGAECGDSDAPPDQVRGLPQPPIVGALVGDQRDTVKAGTFLGTAGDDLEATLSRQ